MSDETSSESSDVLELPRGESSRRSALGEPWSLSTKDVAEHLGVSVDTVYRIPKEALPYMKLDHERRYRASDVERYVERRMVSG